MRAVGTLTDPAAPNNIKLPHRDIFILSWLCSVCSSRTNDYADFIELGEEVKKFLNQYMYNPIAT